MPSTKVSYQPLVTAFEGAAFLNNSSGTPLSLAQVVDEVVRFMRADTKYKYKIMIGSDSDCVEDKHFDFVSAVVVHRVGNGGRYFWRRVAAGPFYTLRDRIIQEVLLSLDLGKRIILELENVKDASLDWDFEIHADIGERGPTKVMIQEVVGMIRAHNFEARTKPDSYAASKVADRHT